MTKSATAMREKFADLATGHLVTDAPTAFIDGVVSAWCEFDLPMVDCRPDGIELDAGMGVIHFRREPDGVAIVIRTASRANTFMLRESVVSRVEAIDEALLSGLIWSELPQAGGLPPNFRPGCVVSVSSLGSSFRRVVIRADDLGAFSRDGLHLRLILPPHGRAPKWPAVDETGRLRWPAGADALHVAVYTIRHVDMGLGTLTIDVFAHGRGPTCAWLDRAGAGAPLGILGPGGGWLPDANHLTLAGDETALPAISRILEAAPRETLGTALVEVERAGDYPRICAPQGISVRELARSAGESLEKALATVELGPEGGRHIWFAAEKNRANAMRSFLRNERGVHRAESYVAAYWVEKYS